ncbi:MAG: 5'/3'-nucleotidase SurE [Hyphomicrobiaceae bacterium]
MRILVTNDDGIDAPGLHALRQIAAGLSDDVWVVAPETNHSGAGHSLSLHEPLRLRQLDARSYAVRGTPTDSVIMGVRHILREKRPDLILSGVNRGANMAEDVTYSGTIAACFEGTLIGIRSIAMSLSFGFETSRDTPRWETPIAHGAGVVRKLLAVEWPANVLMNVNFPDRLPDQVAGIRVTSQGRRDQDLLAIDERQDTWGNPYYWLGYSRRRSNPGPGTDLEAVYSGHISVTPLYLNLTYKPMQDTLQAALDA